jgi:hypothetical protein
MASISLTGISVCGNISLPCKAPSHSLRPTERWEGAFFCAVGPHSKAKEPPQWQDREPYEGQKTLIPGAISRYLSETWS